MKSFVTARCVACTVERGRGRASEVVGRARTVTSISGPVLGGNERGRGVMPSRRRKSRTKDARFSRLSGCCCCCWLLLLLLLLLAAAAAATAAAAAAAAATADAATAAAAAAAAAATADAATAAAAAAAAVKMKFGCPNRFSIMLCRKTTIRRRVTQRTLSSCSCCSINIVNLGTSVCCGKIVDR